ILDEGFLPERVVVTHGTSTTEFVYGGFQDFNNPLHRIEALYAGAIVERLNGVVVRDLKTAATEICQVYVVVPVPDSVRTAGTVMSPEAQLPGGGADPAAAETPTLPSGKPDLTGSWQPAGGGPQRVAGGGFGWGHTVP